jgi:3',5'-cyclic AMP phosphodiesterase CpdA
MVHISDLHFGAEDAIIAEALIEDIIALHPTLVVVSGDLTQRAKVPEFEAARAWLSRIPFPQVVVPGNHDVPFYDVFRRFARPLRRYRTWICEDLLPFWSDEECAVLGVTTARSFTWKGGRISHAQIDEIAERLRPLPPGLFKIVVTHHQFIPPVGGRLANMVGRASLALEQLDACGVDLLLAGHLHRGYTGDIKAHYAGFKRSILVAQAGTAISRRRRGEPNSYNVVSIDGTFMTIAQRAWEGTRFTAAAVARYHKHHGEWRGIL